VKDPRYERPRGLDNWRGVGSFGTIGLEIVLSIAFGFFGGRWLDGRFGTAPWISIVGFCFGVAAAVKSVHRAMTEMRAEAEREEREQGNPRPRYDVPERERSDRGVLPVAQDDASSEGDSGKGDGA
jgi:F0F1-type ATP synthase assembly protein I